MKKYRYEIILLVLVLLYFLYFSFLTIQRHRGLYSHYYDLGIMDQTVYNTYKGRFLQMTNTVSPDQINRIAIHADILLAFLAPFYFLYKGPETLLILQALIISLGALPIYLLAKRVLHTTRSVSTLPVVFAFSYLMYPALQRATIYEFHAVTLATTFLLFMAYFAVIKKYIWSFIFFILALMTKEHVALVTGLFGLYLMLMHGGKYVMLNLFQHLLRSRNKFGMTKAANTKTMIFGMVIFLISILWFIGSVWFLIPYFRQGEHFAISRYSDLGNSPSAIITGVLTKPDILASRLFIPSTLTYFIQLLFPVGFLSLFSPLILLISLPELAINLLSNESNMRSIFFQYTSLVTPFVFIAAIYGVKPLAKKFSFLSFQKISLFLFIMTVLGAYFFGPLPFSKKPAPFNRQKAISPEASRWEKILDDDEIVVSATGHIAPHFTNRRIFLLFDSYYPKAQYVLIDKDEVENDWEGRGLKTVYNTLIADPDFERVFKKGSFEVYKKI